jgi:hypothetical protein
MVVNELRDFYQLIYRQKTNMWFGRACFPARSAMPPSPPLDGALKCTTSRGLLRRPPSCSQVQVFLLPPGVRRLLTPQDMPPIGNSTRNFSQVVPMPAQAKPQVPEGFTVERVASGLANPRAIRLAPNGDLFVADSISNSVRILRVPAGMGSISRSGSRSIRSGRIPTGSISPTAMASFAILTGTATSRRPESRKRSLNGYPGSITGRAT